MWTAENVLKIRSTCSSEEVIIAANNLLVIELLLRTCRKEIFQYFFTKWCLKITAWSAVTVWPVVLDPADVQLWKRPGVGWALESCSLVIGRKLLGFCKCRGGWLGLVEFGWPFDVWLRDYFAQEIFGAMVFAQFRFTTTQLIYTSRIWWTVTML